MAIRDGAASTGSHRCTSAFFVVSVKPKAAKVHLVCHNRCHFTVFRSIIILGFIYEHFGSSQPNIPQRMQAQADVRCLHSGGRIWVVKPFTKKVVLRCLGCYYVHLLAHRWNRGQGNNAQDVAHCERSLTPLPYHSGIPSNINHQGGGQTGQQAQTDKQANPRVRIPLLTTRRRHTAGSETWVRKRPGRIQQPGHPQLFTRGQRL